MSRISDQEKVKRLIAILNDIADQSEGQYPWAYERATDAVKLYGDPVDSQRGMMFDTLDETVN